MSNTTINQIREEMRKPAPDYKRIAILCKRGGYIECDSNKTACPHPLCNNTTSKDFDFLLTYNDTKELVGDYDLWCCRVCKLPHLWKIDSVSLAIYFDV